MTGEQDKVERQVRGLANLVTLERKARTAATERALGFLLVNETSALCRYRTAILWMRRGSGGRLLAVSGVPEPSGEALFSDWAGGLCRHLAARFDGPAVAVDRSSLPEPVRSDWSRMAPACALWLPLRPPQGEVLGGLLLMREDPFTSEEGRVLEHWCEAASHALAARRALPRGGARVPGRRTGLLVRAAAILAAILAIAMMWLPVPQTVLADAEIVPRDPVVVRSALDGVIGSVLVTPNQRVEPGMPLLRLDDTELKARLAVARQDLEITMAEYRQSQQAAVTDRDAQSTLPLLAARIEQRQAEVDFVRSLLDRIEINARIGGVAILSDPSELAGRPVRIGERLMSIADPDEVEVELWLPVDGNIPLEPGARVDLFLNVRPEAPLRAELLRADYHARVSPAGLLAFRMRARLEDVSPSAAPRIGWRGTARLHGETVTLSYYLFRRPWAAIRQWLGL